jgi:hypothetical protein
MDFIFDDDVDEVGSDVEAFCPKCKADTAHVVMSKYEDEIRRVQCNVCSDVHAYRKPRGETEEETPEPTSSKKRAAKAKPTWEQVTAKAKKDPRLYMVADRYSENELISHPIFGIGFVSEVMGDNKIEITFQAERRVLVHNRKGMSLPASAYAHAVDATLPAKSKAARERRKAAVKQAVVKSAAAKQAKQAAAQQKAKAVKPGKAAKPARPKPVKRPTVAKGRPAKAKSARAAAPARAKAKAAAKPKKAAKKR